MKQVRLGKVCVVLEGNKLTVIEPLSPGARRYSFQNPGNAERAFEVLKEVSERLALDVPFEENLPPWNITGHRRI